MRDNKWYEDNKEEIVKLYYSPMSVENICKSLQCNKSMIFRKFKQWNIVKRPKIKPPERCNAKYKIDAHYFDEINNEHQAYWLGFIAADGYVDNRQVSFALKIDDIEMVNQLKTDLAAEQPIKYNKDGNPYLLIICKSLSSALIEKGLHHRKSWSLDINKIIQNVPKDLEHHFIRGLFDGDGCIKYYKYSYIKKPQLHFGYTGVENVCNYIKNKLNIERKLIHEGNVTYTVVTRNPKIINDIFDYLYKDATIYLDRKYQTFKEIQMITFNDYNKAIS